MGKMAHMRANALDNVERRTRLTWERQGRRRMYQRAFINTRLGKRRRSVLPRLGDYPRIQERDD
jgi:hypothetical protein